jgi:ribosome-associated protein
MDGLERHVKEHCRERDIEIFGRSRPAKNAEDEWRIIDLGWTVIHLMTNQARTFYELERIWRQTA